MKIDFYCVLQQNVDKSIQHESADNDDGGEGGNQPTQETVLISKKDNKKIEIVTLDQYKNRGCWKRIRKRLCSSHRFKNLQVNIISSF